MNRVAFTIALLLALLVSNRAHAKKPCSTPRNCGDLEVCHAGKCEMAIGRVYTVTVVDASVAEKKRSGHAWDAVGGLPDPQALVFFPNMKKKVATTKVVKNTLKPTWNKTFQITVAAQGQSIFFCFVDADFSAPDPIHSTPKGGGNCIGYKNVIDFIRAGRILGGSKSAELRKFKATIRRK